MTRTIKDLLPHKAIGHVMASVLDPYYKEGKKRVREEISGKRAAAAAERSSSEMPLNEATYKVMERAAEHVSGGGRLPFSARRLYYAVRDMIKEYTTNEFDQDNGYRYFQSTILQDYQREYGKLKGLYYDPRGRLHEPHGGRTVDVGTQEVESYAFPKHVFNKLLYVEKKGQFPLINEARLMDRYDMAVMTGEGYATEAARTLLSVADKNERMQIFVMHDADKDGYNIARKVRDATKRMPDYSVDVIDLGLTVTQALDLGLDPEPYDRKKELDADLVEELLETEPVELIESGLSEAGIFGKVVPPAEELPKLAEEMYRHEHGQWVEETLHDLISLEKVKMELADEFMEEYELENARRFVEEGFEEDETLSWRSAFEKKLETIQEKHTDALKEAVRKQAIEALAKQ